MGKPVYEVYGLPEFEEKELEEILEEKFDTSISIRKYYMPDKSDLNVLREWIKEIKNEE